MNHTSSTCRYDRPPKASALRKLLEIGKLQIIGQHSSIPTEPQQLWEQVLVLGPSKKVARATSKQGQSHRFQGFEIEPSNHQIDPNDLPKQQEHEEKMKINTWIDKNRRRNHQN
ncbi:hypothetical protein L3X38_025944 [Prunus dulcis]|uniref:Uncharacterized protein n=1 Tax=Prunus dulcis TaxID=3755 RepID=A0AAD4W2P2_PRUDU|nr:hypothetical protein L3X38_025944 [Prunus dulcis]